MQSAITSPADPSSSEIRETQQYAHLYRGLSGWPLARHQLRRTLERLSNIWCIWSGAARSFVWHIRIQSATEIPSETLGPAPVLSPDGLLLDQPGTRARVEGIRNLSAKYPWVDIVHHRIFLMGFDAGARMSDGNLRTESDKHIESRSSGS
jgi:hypothetical protein